MIGSKVKQRSWIALTAFAALAGAPVTDLEGLKLVDFNRLQAGYFRLDQDDGV